MADRTLPEGIFRVPVALTFLPQLFFMDGEFKITEGIPKDSTFLGMMPNMAKMTIDFVFETKTRPCPEFWDVTITRDYFAMGD